MTGKGNEDELSWISPSINVYSKAEVDIKQISPTSSRRPPSAKRESAMSGGPHSLPVHQPPEGATGNLHRVPTSHTSQPSLTQKESHFVPMEPGSRTSTMRSGTIPFPRTMTMQSSDLYASDTSHSGSSAGWSSAPTTPISNVQRAPRLGAHRFLVSSKVGQGGFGCVYKAVEVHTGETVAVKTVCRRGISQARTDMTLKEQRISKRIAERQRRGKEPDGDFVVRMVASFLTLNHFVFILDYHGAGDLRDVDYPLKPNDARFYIGEMTLGLRFIHSLGIVMRDLKPANVLLGWDGHVRLADFGLATLAPSTRKSTLSRIRHHDESEATLRDDRPRTSSILSLFRLKQTTSQDQNSARASSSNYADSESPTAPKRTRTQKLKELFARKPRHKRRTTLCGTPGYIPPEGYNGIYGPEGDVWALGISLYEFITGVNPFDLWGAPTSEIQGKVAKEDPEYPPDMDDTTRDLLVRLLDKVMQRRATIEQMIQHPFFTTSGFCWKKLAKREIAPPSLPDVSLRRLRKHHERKHDLHEEPLILKLEEEVIARQRKLESRVATKSSTLHDAHRISAQDADNFFMNYLDYR